MNISQTNKTRYIRILMSMALLLALYAAQSQAADQKSILMLGGDYCESYPKELAKALMTVKGVKSVDLDSMPGHAVVVHDESVLPEKLVEVIKGVKGDGWYCTGQLM